MSPWRPERVGVGLCMTGVAIARGAKVLCRMAAPATHSAASAPDAPVDSHATRSWTKILSEIRVDFGGRFASGLRLTLAPSLLRWLVVETLPGVRSLHELRQLAALQFEQSHDTSAGAWAIRGNWRAEGPWLCLALPLDLAMAIEELGLHPRDAVATSAERALALLRTRTLPKDFVWAEVAGGYGTLFWIRGNRPIRVSKVRVDERQPGTRLLGEVRRHTSESALPVHWVAPSNIVVHGAGSWTRQVPIHSDGEPLEDSGTAAWAALLGANS